MIDPSLTDCPGPDAGAIVCVTGASRGIGKAVAETLAARGNRLLLLARSETVRDAAQELGGAAEALGVPCDVADFASVEKAVAQAVERWGRIDVLVNAAAILGPTGELWTNDPDAWKKTVDADLCGTYNTMRAILPAMVERKRGKIVNFAGGGAAYGYPLFSAYGASKAAVVRLTETAAMELADHNVQVNVLAPGAIDTDMLRQVRQAGGEVRSVGRMEDAVKAALYLASSDADHISGRFLHARDPFAELSADMPGDLYTLRRVQP